MLVKTSIGNRDQLTVKPAFLDASLVASDQQYCLAVRIEGKSHAPDTVVGIEPQLLHIGMLRSVKRIDLGSAKCRSKLLQHCRPSQQLVLYGLGELIELWLNSSPNLTVQDTMQSMPC